MTIPNEAVVDTGLSEEEDPWPGDGKLGARFDVTLPPYSETFWCYIQEVEEATGITGSRELPHSEFLHHQLVKAVPEGLEALDGEVFDCRQQSWYETAQVILSPLAFDRDFPDGVAYVMEEGERYLVDSHWINPTDEEQTESVGIEFDLVPREEVDLEVGSFFLDLAASQVDLPPGISSLSFNCPVPSELNVLQLLPHMHGYGQEFAFGLQREDAEEELVFEVSDWESYYQYQPPIFPYPDGSLVFHAGEQMRTQCTWNNPGSDHIVSPAEMCTTIGIAYPMEESLFCLGIPDE